MLKENNLEYKLAAQASASLKKIVDALARASSLYFGQGQNHPLSSIKRFWIDHQLNTSVRANTARGRLAMPWSVAAHRHGEQLVSWYAHRNQSIEDRECLRGG